MCAPSRFTGEAMRGRVERRTGVVEQRLQRPDPAMAVLPVRKAQRRIRQHGNSIGTLFRQRLEIGAERATAGRECVCLMCRSVAKEPRQQAQLRIEGSAPRGPQQRQ